MFTGNERVVRYTVSNFMLGSRVPYIGGNIVARHRTDRYHTNITVEFETKFQEETADRILAIDRHPKLKVRCDAWED